jgi:hypothetical protein
MKLSHNLVQILGIFQLLELVKMFLNSALIIIMTYLLWKETIWNMLHFKDSKNFLLEV